MRVAGRRRYVYRAVDEHGQVIEVYVSAHRDLASARRFFGRTVTAHGRSDEVLTDLAQAQALETVIEELMPAAFHSTAQYANNRIECDHGRVKARLHRCLAWRPDRQPAWSSLAMRSCRTCDAATTHWALTQSRACGNQRPSMNSPKRSDDGGR